MSTISIHGRSEEAYSNLPAFQGKLIDFSLTLPHGDLQDRPSEVAIVSNGPIARRCPGPPTDREHGEEVSRAGWFEKGSSLESLAVQRALVPFSILLPGIRDKNLSNTP